MPPATRRQEAAARRSAQRVHRKLGTDLTKPIDIFGIVEDEQIWLMFQPMNRLYGAYQSHPVPGVLINSNHPLPLQRYTAAHEFGHHVLGHEMSLDERAAIEDSGSIAAVESQAQIFAGEFLMPLTLVNHVLRNLGKSIHNPTLTSTDVYNVSLALGVSYTAAVNQLWSHKKLSANQAAQLRRVQPIDIKEELLGARPDDARADVWIVRASESGRPLRPKVGDQICVQLVEAPSTGYRWRPTEGSDSGDAHVLAPKADVYEPKQVGAYGGDGIRKLTFSVTSPGRAALAFDKRRAWESPRSVIEEFRAEVECQPRPTGDVESGLTELQRELISAG